MEKSDMSDDEFITIDSRKSKTRKIYGRLYKSNYISKKTKLQNLKGRNL
jgi:hypothetical protein